MPGSSSTSTRPAGVARNQHGPATAAERVFRSSVTDRTRARDFERAGILADDRGVPDLHALRVTLGTMLARAGVTPQVAQRLLRHADYRTTLQHYTALEIIDVSAALNQLPFEGVGQHRQKHRHSPHETTPDDAGLGDTVRHSQAGLFQQKPAPEVSEAGKRGSVRGHSTKRVTGLEPATFSLGS